jgi:hypothetical protein
MLKKVIIAGFLGGLTLMIWLFIVNGFFGFRNRIDMKQIPNERQVYEMLKHNIMEPGRYICNPELTPTNTFPDNEPVYSILYGGVGHEAAGRQSILEFILAIFAATIGAWLLSLSSEKNITNYKRKVFFFMIIGLLIAIFSSINNFGIGSYPVKDALILAIHTIISWTVVGLVVAWRIKPVTDISIKE